MLQRTDGCLDDGHESKTCHVWLIPAASMCPQQLDCSADPSVTPQSDLVGSGFPRQGTTGLWSRLLMCHNLTLWHFDCACRSWRNNEEMENKEMMIVRLIMNVNGKQIWSEWHLFFTNNLCFCVHVHVWVPHEHEKSIIYLFSFQHLSDLNTGLCCPWGQTTKCWLRPSHTTLFYVLSTVN